LTFNSLNFIPEFIEDDNEPQCVGLDPEAFFPQEVEKDGRVISASYYDEAGAKKLCGQCFYKSDCLAYALKNNEKGIWGGTTENERIGLRRNGRAIKLKNSLGLTISEIK
jgi:hypothetical protein